VRLMTIHRAKGLEFPVVCVADLGRSGVRGRGRLLVAPDGRAGLRLATLAGGEPIGALGYDEIAAALTVAESDEERRLLYVAATRAEERLILSGGIDTEKWPAERPGGPPLDWLAPALLGDATGAVEAARDITRSTIWLGDSRGTRVLLLREASGQRSRSLTRDLSRARRDSKPGKALREMAVKSRLRVVHENRDVHPVRDCELGEKTRDVRFDGGLAHEQRCGNLGVGCAGPHRSSDLPLPVCERRQALGSEATAICRFVVAEVREKCAGDRR